MKLLIRAQNSAKQERTLTTVPLRFDVAQRRFTMARAIGDGYYDTPLETDVVPLTLEFRDHELHIIVSSATDVASLARGLEEMSKDCFESYAHSRT
jgi:hypothetical protein